MGVRTGVLFGRFQEAHEGAQSNKRLQKLFEERSLTWADDDSLPVLARRVEGRQRVQPICRPLSTVDQNLSERAVFATGQLFQPLGHGVLCRCEQFVGEISPCLHKKGRNAWGQALLCFAAYAQSSNLPIF